MRTINLQTVYQLVITALLLGACLGLLGQRLQWLSGSPMFLEQPIIAAPSFSMPGVLPGAPAAAPQAQDVTTSKNNDSNVQVEVEVHTRGNANAEARARGPGDTEVKSSTQGEGDGRSVAYLKVPDVPAWTPPVQQILVPTVVAPPAPGSGQPGQPKALVMEEMVNLRAAPTLTSAILGTARRGQEFTIIGRDPTNTWWLVCCDQGQARWIYSGVVQVSGVVDSVSIVDQPVAGAPDTTTPIALPTPTVAPPLPTATPAVQYEFMLAEQAQFEERITPRIHLYVYETQEGLGGYMVSVRKDGQGLPATAKTAPGMPGITWPIPNERQRYTNLKLEFPGISPAGLWEIQLLDANGRPVGPVATFRLQPNDPQQELYVKYRKR
ncbi:MAG: SH3 domain-containing protein [Caldilinea sp. CFX5]|nr:SH3 domain-containing protein [Caldilinea sp. CFX5]